MTKYQVLRNTDAAANDASGVGQQNGWRLAGPTVEATSSDQAIRKHIESVKAGEKNGLFVAIPASRWKPVPVHVENVEKITIGDKPAAPAPKPAPVKP